MLTPASEVEMALLEYRRDSSFRALVDMAVQRLLETDLARPGAPLGETLAQALPDGRTLAKALLSQFLRELTTSQYDHLRAINA